MFAPDKAHKIENQHFEYLDLAHAHQLLNGFYETLQLGKKRCRHYWRHFQSITKAFFREQHGDRILGLEIAQKRLFDALPVDQWRALFVFVCFITVQRIRTTIVCRWQLICQKSNALGLAHTTNTMNSKQTSFLISIKLFKILQALLSFVLSLFSDE